MAQVRLDSVWKVYPGGVEAVRDVSLEIDDGEFVVLVGPSGCGKSTTLRMVAGLEEISKGTITIGERVVNDVHPKDRDIAMVFQNYALYPHMTVYKNMAFALKLRKMPKAEIDKRVRHAAEILGITDLLGRKPKALSGGQRQRVAVGRCIVREPSAFLFDEPLSNLDAKLRVSTRGELKALHHRLKTTTIYVTHDQEEAMTLGDRVVVMSDGLIQQVDSPFEVYQHPVNRFVGGFIGTPPMNFLEGKLEQDGSAIVFREDGSGGVELRLPGGHGGRLSPRIGERVTLGVRPQAVTRVTDAEARAGAQQSGRLLSIAVKTVEPLGDDMDVRGATPGGHEYTVRMPAAESLKSGSTGDFAVDMDRVHVFEPTEFGANLMLEEKVAVGA